jgi:hypothetical protein
MVKSEDIRAVAPALEGYAQKFVDGLVACDMPRRQPDQQEDRVGPARGWSGGPPRRRGMVPPSLKHWHGASPTTAMTHIAVQESVGGKNVDRLEKVSDEQYKK